MYVQVLCRLQGSGRGSPHLFPRDGQLWYPLCSCAEQGLALTLGAGDLVSGSRKSYCGNWTRSDFSMVPFSEQSFHIIFKTLLSFHRLGKCSGLPVGPRSCRLGRQAWTLTSRAYVPGDDLGLSFTSMSLLHLRGRN